MAADPYFDNVTLLLHCDGSDASTTFTDVKGHTVAPAGNAQIDTAQSKFGGASALFDGSGDYLSIDHADFALGSLDYTVEFWVRFNSLSGTRYFFSNTASSYLYVQTSGNSLSVTTHGSSVSCGTVSTGVWYHLAIVRNGNTVTVYLDGVAVASGSVSLALGGQKFEVGACPSLAGAGDNGLVGWLDDIRITKSVARYTTNFTPPTAAFPDTGSSGPTTYTVTIDAGSYLSYPSSAGSAALGGGAVLQRRYTPTATLSSAIQKQGLTQYTLSGSALQKTQTKTTSADSAIGRILTLWAIAGSAELGVQKFLGLAAGYMLAGREYIPSDALVQKTLEKYASANSYVSLVDLVKTTTVDALFSSFKRAYVNSAVQGTATKTTDAGSALSGTLAKTLSAGFYVTGLPSALVVVAQCYLAIAGRLQSGANAVLGKVRTKSPRAGAILGAIFSATLNTGAALTKAATRTVAANTAVTATRNTTAVPSVTVQSSNMKSLSVGAYLRAEPANTATEATRFDGEWVVLTRPVEWSADIRGTEFAPHARDTEWVL